MYNEFVKRVSFADIDYSGLKIEPLLGFYRNLARKSEGIRSVDKSDEGRLSVRMPDTIVFGEGDGPFWLYTNENGFVHRCVICCVSYRQWWLFLF